MTDLLLYTLLVCFFLSIVLPNHHVQQLLRSLWVSWIINDLCFDSLEAKLFVKESVLLVSGLEITVHLLLVSKVGDLLHQGASMALALRVWVGAKSEDIPVMALWTKFLVPVGS